MLEETGIIGLASLTACMEGHSDRFGLIHVLNSWNPKLQEPVTFMAALWNSLPSHHAKGMMFSIRSVPHNSCSWEHQCIFIFFESVVLGCLTAWVQDVPVYVSRSFKFIVGRM